MNFLGHAYFSFENADLLAGQMFSDFVKGKRKDDFAEGVRNGIMLHRALDSFTDANSDAKKIAGLFKGNYGRYSAAIADVVLDYFLANDKSLFADSESLFNFSVNTYKRLETFQNVFPARFASMFPYMRSQNWLYNYRTEEGIANSLKGLQRRAMYMADARKAFDTFLAERETIQTHYANLIPALISFATKEADGYLLRIS